MEEDVEVPNTEKKRKHIASAIAGPSESQQDDAEDTNTAQQAEASKATGRKKPKRKIDTFKPPREDESDEDVESPKKKPKLKAKAAKVGEAETTAPTRRSARRKGIYEPPKEKEDEDKEGGEADDEPSLSAKGGKRKKRAAAVTKKAKTNK